ncbi:MAG TPA: M99 family carboxypeptidase catalytic domain-containing protein [Gammaproteobacteria bacterium]|nr:M99 family carboxypeptidase catalytic domain-containing protein [Gammaproteobacteria bacterium]
MRGDSIHAKGRYLLSGLTLCLALTWPDQASFAAAGRLEFSLYRNDGSDPGNTLLVVGGIQGDEPGGFNAASLLVTHYRFTRGAVWVVPNLNFESIVRRSRGVYGDMNRKFPAVPSSDPDYERVEKIKRIITDQEVDFVFNLHDGSGFYRERHVDRLRNPNRWGQSIIIDQESISPIPFGDLGEVARQIAIRVNERLLDVDHAYRVKNTRTREGNREMAKTLTYYAINNGKPAVGVEASKSLPTHLRAFYHLQVLEAYMRRFGIGFERSFELTPQSVKRSIDDNIRVSFYDNRVLLEMADARKKLGYVPLKKDAEIDYQASSPLVAILRQGSRYRVSYGNRRITELHPQFFEYDSSRHFIAVYVDGQRKAVGFGRIVEAHETFVVEPQEGYRVNVIGWRQPGVHNESGIEIRKKEIVRRFSVDNAGTTFRIEVYRDDKFTGMVLVKFVDSAGASREQAARPIS